jgi:molybdopterin-guanine dinucleotide biosynthesis protein A
MTVKYNIDCLGVVLCGGLSSRMGEDKSLLKRENETMLSFSQKQLNHAGVCDIVVSGKKHGIADQIDNLGPMGGIFTIIEKYHPKAILVLPVDLPLINSEALKQLKRVGELSKQPCFYQQNYLPLYLPITVFVKQFFDRAFIGLKQSDDAKRGPSIKALLNQTSHKCIAPINTKSLFNANTPEQWQQAKQQFGKSFTQLNQQHRKFHV